MKYFQFKIIISFVDVVTTLPVNLHNIKIFDLQPDPII